MKKLQICTAHPVQYQKTDNRVIDKLSIRVEHLAAKELDISQRGW